MLEVDFLPIGEVAWRNEFPDGPFVSDAFLERRHENSKNTGSSERGDENSLKLGTRNMQEYGIGEDCIERPSEVVGENIQNARLQTVCMKPVDERSSTVGAMHDQASSFQRRGVSSWSATQLKDGSRCACQPGEVIDQG